MKTAILAALLAASFGAAAEGDIHKCGLIGNIYATAARAKELGHNPEMALSMVSPYKEIPIEDRKVIINTVYFDARFERAGGPALMHQMMNLCIYGPTNYKPLK